MAAHDVLLGLPLVGNANKGELRTFLVKRVPYTLTDAEAPSTFIALVTGAIPNAIGWHRTWFWYDPLGASTAVDNVTVIQTQDGYIYKADSADLDIHSVNDRDLAVPPGSPAIGDTYLIAAGASGAWAGKANFLTIWTERGWLLIAPRVGDWVLVEDEDVYVRYRAAGTWSAGPGNSSYAANSIPWSALINVDPLNVENQTTNAPPGAPVVPVAYIIGPAPSGSWTGHARKIAKCELNGVYTIYTPLDGQRAYDKALDVWHQWYAASSTWVPATGTFAVTIYHNGGGFVYAKPARLIGILVELTGGGGGAFGTNGIGTNGTAGGTSSFGAHCSATGGGGGTSWDGTLSPSQGAPGVGSSGNVNDWGSYGQHISVSGATDYARPGHGSFYGGGGRAVMINGNPGVSNGHSGGGGGGYVRKWIPAASLAANETVTIGGPGTGGNGNGWGGAAGENGIGGAIILTEYKEA